MDGQKDRQPTRSDKQVLKVKLAHMGLELNDQRKMCQCEYNTNTPDKRWIKRTSSVLSRLCRKLLEYMRTL